MDKKKQIFDEYGNYDFPTDTKQKGLNTVSSRAEKNNHSVEDNKMVEDIKSLLVCKKWGEYFLECDESVECVDCIAKAIYNAGYRKIPENAVVLTEGAYSNLLSDEVDTIERDIAEYWATQDVKSVAKELHKEGYRKLDDHTIFVLRKAKGLEEKVRKETAEKFAGRVKMAFYYEFDELIPSIMADKIDEICKEIMGGKV